MQNPPQYKRVQWRTGMILF